MPIALDPEIEKALVAAMELAGVVELPQRDDAVGLRTMTDASLLTVFAQLPPSPDVATESFTIATTDGEEIEARWYRPSGAVAGSAVVYAHGGGMISGTLDNYDNLVRHYAQRSGVPFLAIGYRLAPEHRGPTPATDVFDGLLWAFDHAGELGVDPARIALMGDSAGGGVAAAAAIISSERGLQLAKQILVYPMLDDRNTVPDPRLVATATWTYDGNYTGWHALLGEEIGGADVSPLSAPARLTNFEGLAPAFLEVGELDIFCDETIRYAHGIMQAGISCELHVYPGAPHGYDWLDPNTEISRRAVAERIRVLRAL